VRKLVESFESACAISIADRDKRQGRSGGANTKSVDGASVGDGGLFEKNCGDEA
jgi:hypothetical protein